MYTEVLSQSDRVAIYVGIGAAAVALPPTIQVLRDWLDKRKAMQDILNALPNPEPLPLGVEQDYGYLERNSLECSQLEGRIAVKPKALYKGLKTLVREGKVQVFIIHGVAADDANSTIAKGSYLSLPMFFKGGMNPSLRADPSEVEKILSVLTRS